MKVKSFKDVYTIGPFVYTAVSGFPGHMVLQQKDTLNFMYLIVNSSTLEVVRAFSSQTLVEIF